jgi:hypothetical protein
MIGRALVIGAADGGADDPPSAAELDVGRVTALLAPRFEVEQLSGRAATRDGILAAYARLIECTDARDAAVVYFAGHGGLAFDLEPVSDPALPSRFQFIAPSDYEQTTEEDFRGISSLELSLLLARLTHKTHNVTVILDCCHSAQMSRGDTEVGEPRAVELTRTGIRRHLEAVRARHGADASLSPTGNPHAVRIVACGEWQPAFEMTAPDGPTGSLTHALLEALRSIGEPRADEPRAGEPRAGEPRVSWRMIGAAIREQVLQRAPNQRPMIEGPVRRRPFSLEEVHDRSVSLVRRDGALRLVGGRITGVTEGDVYGVTAVSAGRRDASTELGRVRVERAEASHSIARALEEHGGPAGIPDHAVAWPIELALPRAPVRVVASGAEREQLAAALERSARLRVADDGEGAVGELHLHGGVIGVHTFDGVPLGSRSGAWSQGDALRQLEQLATARILLELAGEGIAPEDIDVEWGTVHGGERAPRPPDGAAVSAGDEIYIALHNHSRRPLFAHVFNIGIRGEITCLSGSAADGMRLGPSRECFVGAGSDLQPTFPVAWPEGVRRDLPAVDRLVAIVTTEATDLRGLATDDPCGARRAMYGGTSLQRLAAQLQSGDKRSVGSQADEPFLVVHRSWVLYPLSAPVALAGFAADDDPTDTRGASTRAAWCGGAGVMRTLAIRLRDVAAAGPLRLDALVCTRSADRGRTYEAHTFRLDGAAPAGGLELWRGAARDLIEIFVWATPEPAGRPDLRDLLAPAFERPEIRETMGEAIDALVVSDEQAPWAMAAGACAALANAAGVCLRAALPDAAGLVHLSFPLADPPRHLSRYRAPGVELDLELVDLGGLGALGAPGAHPPP